MFQNYFKHALNARMANIILRGFCNKTNPKNDIPQQTTQKDQLQPEAEQNKKQPRYKVPYNYNYEQHKKYTKDVATVEKENKARENVTDPMLLLPRRQRRIYDRPKYDLDITNYQAWRVFDKFFLKRSADAEQVVCKIQTTPKALVRTFGKGLQADPKDLKQLTRVYIFQDSDYSTFIIFDYRATTQFWGENNPKFDYENQDDVAPRLRKKKYPSVEEFWQSDILHDFRVNASLYGDFRKFQVWVNKQLKDSEQPGQSWDERANKAYPKLETYDDYTVDYQLDKKPTVFEYDKSFWLDQGEKLDPKSVESNPFYKKITPAQMLSEQYRIKSK